MQKLLNNIGLAPRFGFNHLSAADARAQAPLALYITRGLTVYFLPTPPQGTCVYFLVSELLNPRYLLFCLLITEAWNFLSPKKSLFTPLSPGGCICPNHSLFLHEHNTLIRKAQEVVSQTLFQPVAKSIHNGRVPDTRKGNTQNLKNQTQHSVPSPVSQ